MRATSPSFAGASLSSAAPSGRSLSIARLWVSAVTANMAVTYCATLLSPRWLAAQCTPKVRGGMTGGTSSMPLLELLQFQALQRKFRLRPRADPAHPALPRIERNSVRAPSQSAERHRDFVQPASTHHVRRDADLLQVTQRSQRLLNVAPLRLPTTPHSWRRICELEWCRLTRPIPVYCTHLRVTIADTRDCHGDLL